MASSEYVRTLYNSTTTDKTGHESSRRVLKFESLQREGITNTVMGQICHEMRANLIYDLGCPCTHSIFTPREKEMIIRTAKGVNRQLRYYFSAEGAFE